MSPYDPAEITNDEEIPQQQTRLLLEALDAFTRSESWIEAKRIVEQHRELLSDEADALLIVLIARQEDARAIEILKEHRRLLIHCRDVGIDEAFAERIPEHSQTPPGIDPALWQRMRNADSYEAMLALVLEYPELMPTIKDQVEQVLGGSQMAIVNAIEAFLRVSSWDEARTVIEEHPELLSLDADIWLVQYADFMNKQGEIGIADIVSNRRWLLARCRMYGTARVFERTRTTPDGTRLDVAPELLAQLLTEE